MSWLDRLKALDLPSEQTTLTDAVYVDGPRHIIDTLLIELRTENPWVLISNINYERLKHRYQGNVHLTTKYLLTQRTDCMIYETSNTSAYLRRYFNKPLVVYANQTMDSLMQLYTECCNQMPEYSMNKIVLVLDCRTTILKQWLKSSSYDEFLDLIIYLAMLGKRQLHPLLESVVLCDMNEMTKQPTTTSNLTIIQFIYRLLQLNININDRIVSEIKFDLIKNIILDNHRPIEHEYTFL